MTRIASLALALGLLGSLPAPAAAQDDTCKDHPFFTRMPNYAPYTCEASEFDAKRFPVDVVDGEAVFETVEGAYTYVTFQIQEGARPASPLQILRNHLTAARTAGATVVKEFGEQSHAWSEWADIQQQIATLTLAKDGREYWLHLGSVNDGDYYAIATVEREAMAQVVSATELFEQITREGFITLEVHFDTGSAVLRQESGAALDQAAEMLRANPTVHAEVAGHTDNVGSVEANTVLSQQRADAVRAALVERGAAADRLTAKGFGPSAPVADNRTEDGRARNRRVELTRRP